MKKAFKILGIIIGVLLLLIILLPFLFKDKISSAAEQAINENVDATVVLDPGKVSLSLMSNFPHFTLEIKDFGLINKAPFEGDTLLFAGSFETTIDLMSVIGGGQIKIKKIELTDASMNVLVLPDGTANYDISKAPSDTTQKEQAGEASKFAIKIDKWALNNLNIKYIDARSGTQAGVFGLNHSGSGDFTQDVVDLKTRTSIQDLSVTLDSVNYLKHKKFESELALKWDMKDSKGSFGENYLQLNDFRFSFSGDLNIGGPKPQFDLKFASNQNEIKSLVSLVPGVYSQNFDQIKAEGKMAFDGFVKGSYDSLSLPAFGTRLVVEKGTVAYPNLPQKVEDLNIDIQLGHAQGDLELLKTEIRNFGLRLGANPLSVKGVIEGISRPNVNMTVAGKLNLAECLAAFPVEGINLKGLLEMNLNAQGQYDAIKKQFPRLNAVVKLSNGYAKTKDFPEAVENIQMNMVASNPDGNLSSTLINLENMGFTLSGEPFGIKATVKNLDDIQYDMSAKGIIDLEKMTRIFPLEGMTLAGKIMADLKTAGKMSDVTAKRFEKLPTSGTVDVQQFMYSSKDLTQPVHIGSAKATFNSKEAKLDHLKMKIGQSDFDLAGSVSNYLAYVLRNETLKGNLNLQSTLMNTNELMALTGESKPQTQPGEEAPMEVVVLPANIDFVFSSSVGKMLYDNMVLEQMKGGILLKDGILNLKGLQFQTMDGSMKMDGSYNPTQKSAPKFAFSMDMKFISIAKAYATFNTLKTMAPAAKNLQGKFSTQMNLKGQLDQQMKPDLKTVNGGGLVKVNDAQLTDLKLMAGINQLAKTKLPTQTRVQDLSIKTTIVDGRVNFEPFNLNLGGQVVSIGGSNGLDGTIDYRINTAVPAGAAGAAVAGALSSFTGKPINAPKEIKFEIAATGPASSPKYRVVKVDAGNAKSEAKEAINNKINEAKVQAEAKARAEADRLKKEAEEKARAEQDRLKKEAEKKAKDELEKLKKKFKF